MIGGCSWPAINTPISSLVVKSIGPTRWVAPLLMDLKKRLDPRKNPFSKHAQEQFFLAYRDGNPAGRISAHIDQSFNEFQGNEWGACSAGSSARMTPRRRVRCWTVPRAG